MKRVLIETNTYSYYARGDSQIKKFLNKSDEIVVSVITIGELYLGFKEGNREKNNLELLKSFLSDSRVKVGKISIETCKYYRDIKYFKRRSGLPIPDNDIWIAASAIETDSTLITYDSHFLDIPGLKLWKNLH